MRKGEKIALIILNIVCFVILIRKIAINGIAWMSTIGYFD